MLYAISSMPYPRRTKLEERNNMGIPQSAATNDNAKEKSVDDA